MRLSSVAILAPVAVVVACAPEEPSVGIANPAATFCTDQGGTYALGSTDAAGNAEGGTCTLPDGRTVDAWEYFRANAG